MLVNKKEGEGKEEGEREEKGGKDEENVKRFCNLNFLIE